MSRRDVFDNDDYDDDCDDDEEDTGRRKHFTVQFGTESAVVRWRSGMTIRDAFSSKADLLGFDFSRNLSYRDNHGGGLSGDDEPEPNQIYVASVQHEAKG